MAHHVEQSIKVNVPAKHIWKVLWMITVGSKNSLSPSESSPLVGEEADRFG